MEIENEPMENSFLLKKIKSEPFFYEKEIYDNAGKIEILNSLKKLRHEKLEKNNYIIKHNSLISFLNTNKTKIIKKKDFENLTDIIDIDEDAEIENNTDDYYIVSFTKNKIVEKLCCFKKAKIYCKLCKENSFDINICFTQKQIKDIKTENSNYNHMIYCINNNKLELAENENISKNKEFLGIITTKANINLNELNSSNIFPTYDESKKTEQPLNINKAYFYYLDILPQFRDKYEYIRTKERNNFIKLLSDFIISPFGRKYIFITGPKGIGKTSTLIYLSSYKHFHIFYINCNSIFIHTIEETKKIFKYEILKFLGKNYSQNEDLQKKAFEIINNFENEKLNEFINNLVKLADKMYKMEQLSFSPTIIIDQYQDGIGNLYIEKIKNDISLKNDIKLIICSSLHNEYSKKNLDKIINNNKASIYFDNKNEMRINFISKLINSNKESELICNDENDDFKIKNNFKQFEGIPLFYYLIKEGEDKVDKFIEYIQKDITTNLEKDPNYIFIIKNIIEFIKNDYIISSSYLFKNMKKFPLKYINITKKKIFFKKNKKGSYNFYTENTEQIETNEEESEELSNEQQSKKLKINKLKNNILQYYIMIENKNETHLLEKTFFFEDFNDDIMNKKYKNKKIISNKEHQNFLNSVSKFDFISGTSLDYNYILVYKFDFLFPYLETIFIRIIYKYIQNNYMNYASLVDLGTEDGLFELIVTNYILSERNTFNIKIDNFITVENIVPNEFSIKFFSSNQKIPENKYFDFDNFINKTKTTKIKLENKPYFIKQINFYGKYYDCGVLIPDENFKDKNSKEKTKYFYLVLFQISIKKDKIKTFIIEEHEIIFFFVKKHLETLFDIEITAGYFYYILKATNGQIDDKETYKNYKNFCLGFDIFKNFINIDKNFKLANNNALVTSKFLFLNKASLFKNNPILKNDVEICNKVNKLIYSEYKEIDEEIFTILLKYCINKNDKSIKKTQFHLLGNYNLKEYVEYLTGFFIYIHFLKKNNLITIYLENNEKNFEDISIKKNFCIISNYPLKFKA